MAAGWRRRARDKDPPFCIMYIVLINIILLLLLNLLNYCFNKVKKYNDLICLIKLLSFSDCNELALNVYEWKLGEINVKCVCVKY